MTRRPPPAVRRFTAEPVAAADIDAILEAARWTGSARNRQPWRFAVAQDGALRRELSRCGGYAQHLADAPLVIALAVDESSGADAHFDAGRAAQVLMTAAAERGYGSCPATFFPRERVEHATALVGLDAPWSVRWAIALGRPAAAERNGGRRRAIPSGRLPAATVVVRP